MAATHDSSVRHALRVGPLATELDLLRLASAGIGVVELFDVHGHLRVRPTRAGASARHSALREVGSLRSGVRLHAHVVGAGVEVRLDASRDGRLVAPHHDVVDQAVAAPVGEVLLGEAEPAPVVHVVAGSCRYTERPSRAMARARAASVSSTTCCSGSSSGPSPKDLACARRVLRRDQVRVGTGRHGREPAPASWARARRAPDGRRARSATRHRAGRGSAGDLRAACRTRPGGSGR